MNPPLRYLVRQASKPHAPLVLLLHGYGSNEEDLFSLEPYLDPEHTVISLRAPLTMGPGSYAWFPLAFSEEGPVVLDQAQAETSRQLIADCILWIVSELQTDPARTIIFGFSQGAIMGSGIALTEPSLVSAAVLHSGRILPEFLAKASVPAKSPEFLVLHGLYDPVLPVEHGRAAHESLTKLGLPSEYHEFPIAHQISDESLYIATTWIKDL